MIDETTNRSGGAGRVIFRDGNDEKHDLSRDVVKKNKMPLGTVFHNDDLEGVTAFTKCTYTSFALYDKKKGFYYTRLVLRITDEAYLKEMADLQRTLMGDDWCNAYTSGSRFPWGMIFSSSMADRVRANGRLKRSNSLFPFSFATGNFVFGLGDDYLYQIIDLSQYKHHAAMARNQIAKLMENKMYVEGDNYIVDKRGCWHDYLGMLTGNYMWLPKGALYGTQKARKNSLYYELDTCILLDYQAQPVKMTQQQLLEKMPTSFVLKDRFDRTHASTGWQIFWGIITGGISTAIRTVSEALHTSADTNYEKMVKDLAENIKKMPINNDLSGNIKFWVRRSEIFLEGQDEFEQSDEIQPDSISDIAGIADKKSKTSKAITLLTLGSMLLNKM